MGARCRRALPRTASGGRWGTRDTPSAQLRTLRRGGPPPDVFGGELFERPQPNLRHAPAAGDVGEPLNWGGDAGAGGGPRLPAIGVAYVGGGGHSDRREVGQRHQEG